MRDDELRRLMRRAEHDVAGQVTLSADGVRGLAGRIRQRRIRATLTVGALGVVLATSIGLGVGVGNWGAGPTVPAGRHQPPTIAPPTTTVPDQVTPRKRSAGPSTQQGHTGGTDTGGPNDQSNAPHTRLQQPGSANPQHHTTEPTTEPTAEPTTGPTTEPTLPVATPAAVGDVDGDGRPDAIAVEGGTVTVQATTAGALSVRVPAQVPLEIVGSPDVDGDGYADLWVKTDQVGLMSVATLVRSTGTSLIASPLALPYGGGVEAYHLLSCNQQGTIAGWSGTSADAATWTGTTTTYAVDGTSTGSQPTAGPKPTLPGILGCGITLPPAPEGQPPVTAPAADGDVDGDGQVDTLTTEGALLVVRGTRAGRITAALAGTPLGAHDVDGDGYAEVFVDTGETAEALRFDGRDLMPFASLPVGEHASYVCRGDAIVSAAAQGDDPELSVDERTIRVAGTEPRTLTMTAADFDAAYRPTGDGCGF